MSKPFDALRKIVVAAIGFPLLGIGIILVPLPGPGFLVMLIALIILSTEFEWAGKYADQVKAKLKTIYEKSMARADALEKRANKSDDK
jgi:uncharacterized protein (TIGR02611 family)